MNTTPMPAPTERPWVAGALLVVVGLVLLVAQYFEPRDSGWIVLGTISAFMFFAYAYTRRWGWIIPGMILGGLAVGVGLESADISANGSSVVLGLAGGFIGIYVANVVLGMRTAWWPLIPGGILATVGISQATENTPLATFIGQWWPLLLVAAGVMLLFSTTRGATASR